MKLNRKLWSLSDPECGILPALIKVELSSSSTPVERCFVYCAIFPRDYEFKESKLVLLWMEKGLINQPLEGNKQMEDLGAEYFRELVSRSFFQQSGNSVCHA